MRWAKSVKPLVKSIFSSVVIWLLLLLIFVDFLLVTFRPLQYITDLRFIPLDQHPIVSKIPVYMESKGKVDVLVLGSSLPMNAIARYDQKLFGAPNSDDTTQLRRYLRARYLEEQLTAKFARGIKVSNLSITACMISDLYIILSKSIEAGKKPDMAVLCIAPRDFVDNFIQPIGRTPPFEILQDWKSLGDVIRGDVSSTEARDLLISSVWYFYRVKVDYRTVLTQYFSNFLGREATLYHAIKNQNEVQKPQPKVAKKKTVEVDRYNPPNFRRFALEAEFFKKVLALCKKEGIECFVVNMPMTVSFRAMLDARLDRKYLTEVVQTCHQYDAHYLDFNDSEFVETDFDDGFHVNSSGAEKVMKRLVTNIAEKSHCRVATGSTFKILDKPIR